jgi:hypothetical protein
MGWRCGSSGRVKTTTTTTKPSQKTQPNKSPDTLVVHFSFNLKFSELLPLYLKELH